MYKSIIYVLLIISLLTGCGNPSKVTTTSPEATTAPLSLQREVTLMPLHSMTVHAPISGRLLGTLPATGTMVTAGDLLFDIDTAPYEGLATPIEIVPATPDSPALQEATRLRDSGIITRSEWERIRTRETAGQSNTVSLPNDTPSGKVTAPISGRIGTVHPPQDGILIQDRPVVVIQSITPLLATFPIPESTLNIWQAAWHQPGTNVAIASPDGIYYGEITHIERSSGGVGMLKLQFQNDPPTLVAGNTYRITVSTTTPISVWRVPLSAQVAPDTLYVVNPNGIVEQRQVVTTGQTDTDWFIYSGISPNDRVITSPSPSLEVGQFVS